MPVTANTVRLLNGNLARPGIADSTGAIIKPFPGPGHTLQGSAVLIAPSTILTAAHVLIDGVAGSYAFFLPGGGIFEIEAIATTDDENENSELPPDLAVATLRTPVLSITPAALPPASWQLTDGQKVRVSGFGNDTANGRVQFNGMKQWADVSARRHDRFHLSLGNTRVELLPQDSGGPLVSLSFERRSEPLYVVGISRKRPHRAIHLDGDTVTWIRTEIDSSTATSSVQVQEFDTYLNPNNGQSLASSPSEPFPVRSLGQGERLVVTISTHPGSAVDLGITPGSVKEPNLCPGGKSGEIFVTRLLERPTNEIHYVWFRSCRSSTLAQVYYSITKTVP